jgi:hypothetical protein
MLEGVVAGDPDEGNDDDANQECASGLVGDQCAIYGFQYLRIKRSPIFRSNDTPEPRYPSNRNRSSGPEGYDLCPDRKQVDEV